MNEAFLNAAGAVCALGADLAGIRRALFAADRVDLADRTDPAATVGGLVFSDRFSPGRVLPLGLVSAALPDLADAPWWQRTRCNALAAAALAPIEAAVAAAVARYGPRRVAVVIGGSTSGLYEGERAVQQRRADGAWQAGYGYVQQELGATAAFVAARLGTEGPATVVSTACSSGAKALAAGARLLRAGLADAVVAGGADALCRFTVAGFSALESVSAQRCRPLSATRDGINLGEGAALFLMSREAGPLRLAGWGESSDAHHMSAPAPDGRGAIAAMRQALARAGLPAAAVDYLNLHGTATPHNDAMESLAVDTVFGTGVPVSSTKPLTGHALGAAGAIEAVLAWLALVDNPQGLLPPHWWDSRRDPALPALAVAEPGSRLGRPLRHVLSNSFAFGGSNASLLLSAG